MNILTRINTDPHGQGPGGWSPAVLRFFDYLSAVPLNCAARTLSLWTDETSFEEYATTMVAQIPLDWFSRQHYAPIGRRLVFAGGKLFLAQAQHPKAPPRLLRFHTFQNEGEIQASMPQAPKRRALNSFMAFRSYFSRIFPGVRQSVKSGLLSDIWRHDPLKSHWELMARAYTVIRDNFWLEHTTLPFFMRLVGGFMGMPQPHRYLALVGWTIMEQMIPEHSYTLRGPNFGLRVIPDVRTVTVFDIVEFLQNHELFRMRRHEGSIWPHESTPRENGQMAVRIDPGQPTIDDPLAGLFDDRNWELDLTDVYSTIDDSIDSEDDLIIMPGVETISAGNMDFDRDYTFDSYSSRREGHQISGVPPLLAGNH